MELPGTSRFVDRLRKGAIATAAIGTLFTANAAAAADASAPSKFTEQECKVVAAMAGEVVKAVGPEKLSVEFRRSFMGFIAPDGKKATCTGPTQIATPKHEDIAAYNTIGGLLLQGPKPISLRERGLRAVYQAAALQN